MFFYRNFLKKNEIIHSAKLLYNISSAKKAAFICISNWKHSRRKMSSSSAPNMTEVSASLMNAIVSDLIPPLNQMAHKGQAGRIGIIGGSLEYTGAPYYSALTALRIGADLAHIFCMQEAGLAIKTYSPELIVHPILDSGDPIAEIKEWLPRLHVLLLGPGLGRHPQTFITLGNIIKMAKDRHMPIVIDADALFYLNENYNIIQGYGNVLLTPNRIEMARLFQSVIKKDIGGEDICPQHVQQVAQCLGVTIVCKGANDIIASGDTLILCDIAGSLRRCGGQGDVLAGAAAIFMYWAYDNMNSSSCKFLPCVLAAWGACALTRTVSSLAFIKMGRGTLTTDMLPLVHQAFSSLFLKKD